MMVALVGIGCALLLSGGSTGRARRRRTERLAVFGDAAERETQPKSTTALPAMAGAGAAVVCLAISGVIGIVWACVVAPTAYFAVSRLAARNAGSRSRLERQAVPMVLDLLAAAVAAGAPLPRAMSCVADVAGPSRDGLLRTAALLSLGASPEEAWSALRTDAALAPLAAVAVRSSASGIRLAEGLARQAEDLREQLTVADVSRAERVGVAALLPLGLCFLPAFICLGIVPIVVGVAGDAFGRLGS